MLRWEYRYIYRKVNTNDPTIEQLLNQMGGQGWELSQVITASGANENSAKIHGFVFKRVIQETEY